MSIRSMSRWGAAAGVAGAIALAALLGLKADPQSAAPDPQTGTSARIPDDCKTGGFALGCQAWTFNNFTVFEAIAKTEEAGGKVIEFFPGQKLSKEHPEIAFDHNSSDDVVRQVQEQLHKHHLRAVNYGVVTPQHGEAEWRKVFQLAHKLNLYGVTSEPKEQDMDAIEKLVKEYDIRLCIHDHPKRADNPGYKFWDPHYVLSLVKDRDRRMGACADTGHWVRSGIKPVDALRILEGRVMSSHLKDLNEMSPGAHDVPYGAGVSDVKGILDELKRQGFAGNVSIEYERDMPDKLPEVKQCVEFVKEYGKK